MRGLQRLGLGIAALTAGCAVLAQTPPAQAPLAQSLEKKPVYVSVAAGVFDLDREATSSELAARLDSLTTSISVGVDLHRYVAAELELHKMEQANATDEDGFTAQFEAWGVTPSILLKYPLTDHLTNPASTAPLTAYLRFGATHLAYEADLPGEGRLDSSATQATVGIGLRGRHWFVEYTNHDERHGAELEQLRFGLRWRF